jgi:hypothetical protein
LTEKSSQTTDFNKKKTCRFVAKVLYNPPSLSFAPFGEGLHFGAGPIS